MLYCGNSPGIMSKLLGVGGVSHLVMRLLWLNTLGVVIIPLWYSWGNLRLRKFVTGLLISFVGETICYVIVAWSAFWLVYFVGQLLRLGGVDKDVVMEFILTCGAIFLVIGAEYLGLMLGVPLGISPLTAFFFGLIVEVECIRVAV